MLKVEEPDVRMRKNIRDMDTNKVFNAAISDTNNLNFNKLII